MSQNTQDPIVVASNVYRFIMENDRVRVLNVTFQPGDKAVMHHHPDHVVYVLKGGKNQVNLRRED
jgi:beta-alanine degradation protein BauB